VQTGHSASFYQQLFLATLPKRNPMGAFPELSFLSRAPGCWYAIISGGNGEI
jgi:hypothetical protein